MRMEYSSWLQVEEYFKEHDMVVVPIGSTENHGSHMGLGTDFLVPSKIVDLLEERIQVLSAPPLPYGMADNHTAFPGTLTIGQDGLYLVAKRIAMQLHDMGARKILFLNGHGGNTPVLNRIGMEMEKEGTLCAVIDWWVLAGQHRPEWKGGHAGAQETSAMMAAAPRAVHMELAKEFHPKGVAPDLPFGGASNVLCNGIPVLVPRQTREFSESGWFGDDDIKTASPEWGEQMLNEVADFVADFLRKFQNASTPLVP